MEGPVSGTASRKFQSLERPDRDGTADVRAPMTSAIAERLGRAVNDPVVVSIAGRVVFINAAGERAFGYTADEQTELTFESLLPGAKIVLEARAQTGDDPLTCEARRKDGTRFPAQLSLSRVELDREYEIAIIRDLSAQRHAEDELRRTRDQLAEAQRVAQVGSWEWDIPANKLTWSDELFRIFGLRPGELEPTYEKYLERVHPDDRASVDARNRKALADHQPFDDTKRCLRPDESVFLMHSQGEVIADAAGEPLRMLGICEDVTADVEAERAEAELASIVESSEDAIVATTLDGVITSWNPGATKLYGYEAKEVVGEHVSVVIPPASLAEYQAKADRVVAGDAVEHYDTTRSHKDGSEIDVSVRISPVLNPDGSLRAISTIARDIADRKRFEAELKHLADHDPLTGLANRRRFEGDLDMRVAEARRYDAGGAVLMLDIDNFKYVNDAFGHLAGDDLLRSVALVLAMRLRETDVLARFGGDEFAIFLTRVDQVLATEVANSLLEALRDHVVHIDGRPINVTSSIGIACLNPSTASGDELLADADHAMYQAKDAGRDRAIAGSTSGRENLGETRLGWEHRIREALERDLLVAHCQPIMDLRTGQISQHELLLRMADGDKLIPPIAFLGVAERLGLIHAIDRWVVAEALRLLSAHATLRLEVNLSARSLDEPQLLALIRDGIDERAIDPSRLIFEITETAAVGNTDIARSFAIALDELGCSFALDDFGAGFGSFYYLKHLPAKYLKIDGDFVSTPRTRTDELVIDSIVRIAQGLGKKTIAEHVEDGATLEALRKGGVDFAQGFYVGEPALLTA
jgi:diguanylate cyclase (GGDEF)-like protein/PAS domain S-box-containing protein